MDNGGPHGLGDPDDMTLRKVEKEICIPEIMRDRAQAEKCPHLVKGYENCVQAGGFLSPLKCRKQVKKLMSCLQEAYADPQFAEECTKQYLDERSEYRRTGKRKAKKENIVV